MITPSRENASQSEDGKTEVSVFKRQDLLYPTAISVEVPMVTRPASSHLATITHMSESVKSAFPQNSLSFRPLLLWRLSSLVCVFVHGIL